MIKIQNMKMKYNKKDHFHLKVESLRKVKHYQVNLKNQTKYKANLIVINKMIMIRNH